MPSGHKRRSPVHHFPVVHFLRFWCQSTERIEISRIRWYSFLRQPILNQLGHNIHAAAKICPRGKINLKTKLRVNFSNNPLVLHIIWKSSTTQTKFSHQIRPKSHRGPTRPNWNFGPNGLAPTIFFKLCTHTRTDKIWNLAEETHMATQIWRAQGPPKSSKWAHM